MPSSPQIRILRINVALATIIIPVFITPWWVIYPYSIPKLIPLIGLGISSVVPLAVLLKSSFGYSKKIFGAYISIIVWLLAVLLYPQSNFFQEIYGVDGRNTGFLTYFCLTILSFGAIFISDKTYLKFIARAILAIGIISIVYGIFQSLGYFNIGSLVQDNNISVGFMGNINFHSAFIASVSVLSLSLLIFCADNLIKKIFYFATSFLGLIGIVLSDSRQGLLVCGLGISIIIFVYLRKLNLKYFLFAYIISVVSVFILIFLAIFQKGPLKPFIYEKSISIRGYYWDAGIEMFRSNPIFGVGFDGYRDWYFRSRSPQAFVDLGPQDFAENAHNIFIELAAIGGVPLLILYTIIILYTFRCGVKNLSSKNDFNPYLFGIFIFWICYVVQSILSINQIGLAVLGWISSGLIIGSYLKVDLTKKKEKVIRSANFSVISSMIGLILGIIIGLVPNINSAKYREAVEKQELRLLYSAVNSKPYNAQLMVSSVEAFLGADQDEIALEIAEIATSSFPDYYNGWEVLSKVSIAPPIARQNAEIQMRRLDPQRFNR